MNKNRMDISVLQIIFEGFCERKKKYGICLLLIDANDFSVLKVFNLVKKYKFQICSDLEIEMFNNDLNIFAEESFKKFHEEVLLNGHYFEYFPEYGIDSAFRFGIPRFTELDFQFALEQLGGNKIKEGITKTPDFLIDNIAIELKDLEKEGLYDIERQKSIYKVFNNSTSYAISIDPSLMSVDELEIYKRIVSNSIKNVIKKASTQIKEYMLTNKISNSGVIITNTGFFSLSHDLFKEIVEDIILHQTKTIEFAYIFTQSVLKNAIGDYEAFYYNDFIGIVPNVVKQIKEKIDVIIDQKMTSVLLDPNQTDVIQIQEPISFLVNNKIFYWVPRKIIPSWEVK